MTAPGIRPGESYALAAWNRPNEALRRVTAIRVQGPFLIYAGPSGAEWAADLRRVPGPWKAHADAALAAETAAAVLRETLACPEAEAVEVAYCQFVVRATLTVDRAMQAAEHPRGRA
jgi:hypothetical protein